MTGIKTIACTGNIMDTKIYENETDFKRWINVRIMALTLISDKKKGTGSSYDVERRIVISIHATDIDGAVFTHRHEG
jgi:hypothetical protein